MVNETETSSQDLANDNNSNENVTRRREKLCRRLTSRMKEQCCGKVSTNNDLWPPFITAINVVAETSNAPNAEEILDGTVKDEKGDNDGKNKSGYPK
mmetsp:Transcript_6317/g.13770  ORF Transcript_6317/g.13770 Transcript_6317/m.13770 type:complete len:97 (-) Transcript_6317:26-316(-)